MDARLTDLGRARGGLVTVAEADRVGVTATALSRLAGAGELIRLRRGAYALVPVWTAASEPERYALRTRAVLRTRAGVAAAHHGALLLAGVPLDRVPAERTHVCAVAVAAGRVRTKAGLSVHPRPADSVVHVDPAGDPYLDPASALVLVARDDGPLAAAVALDQALRVRATSVAAVERVLAGVDPRLTWVHQLRTLVTDADPLSPSPAATRLRILLTDLGFRPRLRVPLRDRGGHYLARPELLIGSSLAVVRDAYPHQVLDRLREVGVVVAHVGAADVDHPERVAGVIAQGLARLRELRAVPQAS